MARQNAGCPCDVAVLIIAVARVIIILRGRRVFEVEKAILKTYVMSFFWKEARVSQDINVVGSSFEMRGTSNREQRGAYLGELMHSIDASLFL